MFLTRLRITWRLALGLIAGLTLFRLLFLAIFIPQFLPVPLDVTAKALFIGLRLDLRLVVLVVLPFFLFSAIPGLGISASRPKQMTFWRWYFLILWTVIFFLYVLDFGFYDYLMIRMDASLLAFASSPVTTLKMVWQSYPAVAGVLLLVGGAYGFWRMSHRIMSTVSDAQPGWPARIVLGVAVFMLLGGIGYGKWSRYPLRWSDAFFSTYQPANQLALNPVLYFFNTFTRIEESYDQDRVKAYYPLVADWLGIPDSLKMPLNYTRAVKPAHPRKHAPNVVMIFLETFPTFKVGAYGNPMNASPAFDRLSEEGMHFTNFYVPKLSTAASIFSAMSGIPDVAVIDRSSTRDPYAIRQNLILNDLAGYRKHFFIGGSANWGDVGGFFRNNVTGIDIHEEGDFSEAETNAWGISDYHLLEASNRVLQDETEPFFAIILTAGHHRPYTIPEKIPGFTPVEFTEEYRQNGFNGEEELNAFRFMDFSLGHFMKLAREEAYFENTLFVFFGDHGIGHILKPVPYGDLSLHFFHVPLLLYGPGLDIAPETIDRVMSEIDIMPTLLGILGQPYTNTTLGRDVFGAVQQASPGAFMFSANTTDFAWLQPPFYVLCQEGVENRLYLPWSDEPVKDQQHRYPEAFQQLQQRAHGIMATAQYLRYNNKPPEQ
ncbi:MAG: sulfatase-like hydrolase/transferase [Lentisphaeria bacterium]|nr:sulfatase-like hydrolase/transferase [Candidatus Neomarinimicrobiota bacterium]MCF7843029.1 sulfatase-like hydrolase/transferase [Lentisphaeria bacterium]